MKLFHTDSGNFTDKDLLSALKKLDLRDKNVLCYSRLFSFGMMSSKAPARIIETMQKCIGDRGSLTIPCYTFSAYNNEVFDIRNSRCAVGILGETARKMPDFIRTIHPVYSNVCWGISNNMLDTQKPYTCFGKDSFFSMFKNLPQTYLLLLGVTLSAATICHYYDQSCNAPGRFIKNFYGKVIGWDGISKDIKFDSFVKDHLFYAESHPCLAMLDAYLTKLKLLSHIKFSGSYIHGIDETILHKTYSACLRLDQRYFLMSSKKDFDEYYQRNNFQIYHNKLLKKKADDLLAISKSGAFRKTIGE